MSIWVDKNSRVVVQGITGSQGRFHTKACKEYGTNIVAGVTPGKGGQSVEGIPVFNSVDKAVKETGADTSLIFVPAPLAMDAILEAKASGVKLSVCITDGIPTLDMVVIKRALDGSNMRLIGPNCPGIISPGGCKIGIMPGLIHKPGHIGVVSRSGTLTYEAVDQLSKLDLGQSTAIGIGGDPILGTNFIDCLAAFENDKDTKVVVLIGEIGGSAEEEAADFIKAHMSKPVAVFIAGQTAPKGKRMGHAGAIIARGKGTAAEKIAKLKSCGIRVIENPVEIGKTVKYMLS